MASPSPADSSAGGSGGGPMLGLLSRGLELWLRQQCEAIESLEIDLEGSAAQLLRGRLSGVRLRARRVVFQQLCFEQVELRSEPIQVRMGALLRSRSFELEQAFSIQGVVVFSADGLRRTLGTPQWHGLGDQVAEELLGITPLADLRIEEDRLILQAPHDPGSPPLERSVRIRAVEGTVELQSEELQSDDPGAGAEASAGTEAAGGAAAVLRLPMDPNVQVQRAAVGGGLLELHGDARVLP
ncbi:MAG: DUF2993 domain-containing protein [Synechococcaceae cyanobacterium]|nr:DUF2993 domain-containing protein [Synechococcaceae cyanobacterium]